MPELLQEIDVFRGLSASAFQAVGAAVEEVALPADTYLFREGDTAEIVRMSVAAHMRHYGIGQRLLQHLVAHAKARGYRQIILETTATWYDVIAFYQQNGFQITHYRDGDVYFVRDL